MTTVKRQPSLRCHRLQGQVVVRVDELDHHHVPEAEAFFLNEAHGQTVPSNPEHEDVPEVGRVVVGDGSPGLPDGVSPLRSVETGRNEENDVDGLCLSSGTHLRLVDHHRKIRLEAAVTAPLMGLQVDRLTLTMDWQVFDGGAQQQQPQRTQQQDEQGRASGKLY